MAVADGEPVVQAFTKHTARFVEYDDETRLLKIVVGGSSCFCRVGEQIRYDHPTVGGIYRVRKILDRRRRRTIIARRD